MSDVQTLADRMKAYEDAECAHRFMPLLPILIRVDGRAFHSFTRGMDRPFDGQLSHAMTVATTYLVNETGALMGYTQSDEITLALYSPDPKSQVWFDGRVCKIVSQSAALATLHFNHAIAETMPEYASRKPTFDARAWQVPTLEEAANVFLWRERDAVKNSITAAAQSVYSHKELDGKDSNAKQEMLFQKGINWNDYEPRFKRGTYVQRRTLSGPFTATEIENLPEKHEARRNPDLIVARSKLEVIDMPPLGTVLNRVAVIFDGAQPQTATMEPLNKEGT